jgi:hypothetical protein
MSARIHAVARSLLLSLLLLSVCLIPACNPIQDTKEAEAIVDKYFAAMKGHDFNRALDFYAPEFFQKTPSDKWLRSLESINGRLGDLQDYTLGSWHIDAHAGTGAGTYYTLQYVVHYAKFSSTETFVLEKLGDPSSFKILSQNIQSDGLLAQ